MARYWFARRRLDQPMNRRMAPVSREGWLVVWTFIGCMVLGGAAFVALALMGWGLLGLIIYVVLAAVGLTLFLTLAYRKGDLNHTVEDYRLGRVSNEEGAA